LAKLFTRERHNITVIDDRPELLQSLSDKYDLLTKECSPVSIEALRSVEAGKADLFIGVTPDETHNLAACMLARKMGAKKTVARVDNAEYTENENKKLFQSVGIDAIIMPEMIAAQEIVNNISKSWIRQWWEVDNSELVMMGIKIRENCKILNKPLKELCGADSPFHIVAIKRNDETIIPHGNDCINVLDLAFFMTKHKYATYIRELCGKQDYPEVKRVTIMGGGITSFYTAKLLPDSIHVKIIEQNKKRCETLYEQLDESHITIINGDARNMSLLQEENIHNVEAFVALTDSSETNILSCLTAKRNHVHKTVAMLDNLGFVSMAESLDIGTLINKQNIAASYIYQMILKADVSNVRSLVVANADVAEFIVKEGAKVTKHLVRELRLPQGTNLGGLVRNGVSMLINGNTRIQAGDRVVAFCLGNDLNKLTSYF